MNVSEYFGEGYDYCLKRIVLHGRRESDRLHPATTLKEDSMKNHKYKPQILVHELVDLIMR